MGTGNGGKGPGRSGRDDESERSESSGPEESVKPISADRLIDAADAVLRAVETWRATSGRRYPWPPDLVGAPDQPASLEGFTRAEIEEASRFLSRLDMIKAPGAAPSAG